MLKLSEDDFELFLVQCWMIWNQRNSVLHESNLQEPAWLNARARNYIDENKGAQTQLEVPVSNRQPQVWQPPKGSVYKLNFDAAIFADMAASGIGAVIWNDKGEVMAALSSKGPTMTKSEEPEVLACRKALESAMEAGFPELVIEGDNINVMQSITSPRINLSRLGNIYDIYDDIRCIAGSLWHMEIKSIRRSANRVAHSLARNARL